MMYTIKGKPENIYHSYLQARCVASSPSEIECILPALTTVYLDSLDDFIGDLYRHVPRGGCFEVYNIQGRIAEYAFISQVIDWVMAMLENLSLSGIECHHNTDTQTIRYVFASSANPDESFEIKVLL